MYDDMLPDNPQTGTTSCMVYGGYDKSYYIVCFRNMLLTYFCLLQWSYFMQLGRLKLAAVSRLKSNLAS